MKHRKNAFAFKIGLILNGVRGDCTVPPSRKHTRSNVIKMKLTQLKHYGVCPLYMKLRVKTQFRF